MILPIFAKLAIVFTCAGLLALLNRFVDIYALIDELADCPRPPLDICPNENVTFHLFNRRTDPTDGYQLKEFEPETMRNAPFIKNKKVIISCHGYGSRFNHSPTSSLIVAYERKQEDVNIIAINWEELCPTPCYIQATRNAVLAGRCTAAFIELLLEHQPWLGLKDIHYVGFSLGAQVGSQVARFLTIGKLPRLTALDAAFPLFDPVTKKEEGRLDKNDADFVDAYHTNAGEKGEPINIGHVDFYANFALLQPGCGAFDSGCNHKRAVEYFAESIYTDVGFYACKRPNILPYFAKACDSNEELILLGAYVNQNVTGTYFFTTNSESPFAKGKA